jgi:hypothetical protein
MMGRTPASRSGSPSILESLMASAIDLLSGHEPVQIRSYVWAPLTSVVMLALDPTECGPGSVHEELTQIAIPACAVPSRRSLPPVQCWRDKSPSHAADGRARSASRRWPLPPRRWPLRGQCPESSGGSGGPDAPGDSLPAVHCPTHAAPPRRATPQRVTDPVIKIFSEGMRPLKGCRQPC